MSVLEGLRVIEGSAFVVAPLGGMALAQLGADVIRFDAIGGGIDFNRWPCTPEGTSLFWTGMNKGKRSLAVDVQRPEGREIVSALISKSGRGGGIFLSNFPARGWLSDESLRVQRPDLIYINILGNPDGSTAVDYTVNPASGFAYATGPVGAVLPTNHVLPAWDIATGMTAVVGLLAAERYRASTGIGQYVSLALADVAFAMASNLGYLAQAQLYQLDRPPLGNDMYGTFGRDFSTADGRRVMVVAISLRQWDALVDATGIGELLPLIENALDVDLALEGDRFIARDALAAFIAPWIASRTIEEVGEEFNRCGVCWGPYQTFRQLLDEDWRTSDMNPMFSDVVQPGVGTVRAPASPLSFSEFTRTPPRPAPLLGEHTNEILSKELGLSAAEIGRLHDSKVVASA